MLKRITKSSEDGWNKKRFQIGLNKGGHYAMQIC